MIVMRRATPGHRLHGTVIVRLMEAHSHEGEAAPPLGRSRWDEIAVRVSALGLPRAAPPQFDLASLRFLGPIVRTTRPRSGTGTGRSPVLIPGGSMGTHDGRPPFDS
jgi:hypothetical protein